MDSNKSTYRDVVFIFVGGIIGLVTGLITAQITQRWIFDERAEIIANNIRGNVSYELENNEALSKLIKEIISKKKNTIINGLTWKHSDLLISAAGNEIGFLMSDVIKKYTHYYGMLKQLQYARDQLIKKYEKTDKKGMEKNTRYYIECIDFLEIAGKDLIDSLDRFYPEEKHL